LLLRCGLWDPGQQVLYSTIGIEEGSAHGPVDLFTWKAHRFHVCNGSVALLSDSQGIGIVEGRTSRRR
jgi:hypothetical protein